MTTEDILNEIIKKEGGYINHPNDKGGPTKYGITLATLAGYYKLPAKKVSIGQVKNLSIEVAKEIYRELYINGPRFNTIKHEHVLSLVVDMGVNHGITNATKILQRALNGLKPVPIEVDGKFGPMTNQAIDEVVAAVGETTLNNTIVKHRTNFYDTIVRNNPSQKVFWKGWITRAKSFLIKET